METTKKVKKRIIVTGGNRGIGLEIVKRLANQGHEVILAARNTEAGRKVAREFTGAGCEVTFIEIDLEYPDKIKKFIREIQKQYHHIDVLINNAGVFLDKNFNGSTVPMEAVRRTMQINVLGHMELSKALIPMLMESKDGRIINMSSGLGSIADMAGGYPSYRMSKVAMNAYTRILADELNGQVKVNSMCPGWVKTEMGGVNAPRSLAEGADTAVWLATAAEIPTGKFFRDRQEIPW